MKSFSIAAGQKHFPRVVAASQRGEPVPIERHGSTVAYVVSKERFDSYLETMELLSSAEFVRVLRLHRQRKLPLRELRRTKAAVRP